jgi:hypothetical protein
LFGNSLEGPFFHFLPFSRISQQRFKMNGLPGFPPLFLGFPWINFKQRSTLQK